MKAFKLTYRGYISPMPNLSMWPDVEEAPLEPPKRRNTVGKPKKNRRRKPDEGLAPSKSFTKHCKSCGSYRHNKRTVPRLINNHLGCRGTNLKKLRKTVTDSNAPVQEKALDVLIAFLKVTDADVVRYAKEVCDAIVENALRGDRK
ncbi:hypothetical protein LWI28_012004 [Acer negundo]|uniref:XMAP215/Dis1/CLASP TOG domain-containing protein n=1 Tax=Acer negundo TaxID=4023 RepID=A0AAD5JQW1_ACENE|nr:hypothetical protein LWI28_012004 [Acer negundo]